MATLAFDTLKLARRLEAGGFTAEQAATAAEALAETALNGTTDLATKADLAAVKADVSAVKTDLATVKGEITAELHRELGAVRREMNAMTWKLAALLIAQAATIVALIRLLS
jgi:hypothetical protein